MPGIGINLDENSNFDISRKRLVNVGLPLNDNDACTKGYVQEKIIEELDSTAIQNSANNIGARIDGLEATDALVFDEKILPAYNHSIEEHFDSQLFSRPSLPTLPEHTPVTGIRRIQTTPNLYKTNPLWKIMLLKQTPLSQTNPTVSNLKVEGDFEAGVNISIPLY